MNSLYTKRCESLNALTHLLGAIFAVVALIVLLINNKYESNLPIIIYGISMFIMFFSSFSYHFAKNYKLKGVLQKLDHSAIYLFIPSCFIIFLTYLVDSSFGFWVLVAQYVIAALGIILNFVKPKGFKKLHLVFYLGLGWSALLFLDVFLLKENLVIFSFILLGGLLYTVGVYFYKQRKEFSHVIWHIFIILAAVSQFISNFMIIS